MFCEPIQCPTISCSIQHIPANECCPVCGTDQRTNTAHRNPDTFTVKLQDHALCPTTDHKTTEDTPVFDFLDLFNLTSLDRKPVGVMKVTDDFRQISAFKITRKAKLVADTKQVLPGYLPDEFAIIAHMRFPTVSASSKVFNVWQVNDRSGKPLHGLHSRSPKSD